MASPPRYGLTVTASAPSPSNSATAWRAAVVPMSPRFASATTGRSAGSDSADPLEGRQPGRPERLEEGEVRLDRRRERSGGLGDQRREALDAGAGPARNPAGSAVGSGSSPRHRTVSVAAERAARRSR